MTSNLFLVHDCDRVKLMNLQSKQSSRANPASVGVNLCHQVHTAKGGLSKRKTVARTLLDTLRCLQEGEKLARDNHAAHISQDQHG